MLKENAEIIEGFLCPICMEDLGTILGLHSHFSEKHKEEKDVLTTFKGLLGKAKTIFNEGSSSTDLGSIYQSSSRRNEAAEVRTFEEQRVGITRSHTSGFKEARDDRISYKVTRTNQLLVRLDKLVSDLPFEPSKRKVHEQNVVLWATDDDVKLCPECTRSFGLLRRRHHCRLCGSIQCNECSSFILVSRARKLIYPNQGSPEMPRRMSSYNFKKGMRLKVPSSSASLASVQSLADMETGEPHLRTCKYCLDLIEQREKQIDARTQRPAILVLYDSLISNKLKAAQFVVNYTTLAKSLWDGETAYHLSDAQNLRMDLMKLADTLDTLSKRIANLGKDQESPIPGTQLSLQNKVRYATAQFLKDNLLGLPSLPSQDELENLIEEKRLEAKRRLDALKERARPRSEQVSLSSVIYSTVRTSSPEPVSYDVGWVPESSVARKELDGSDHPLVEQMHLLRNYVKEARKQHRYDDVFILQKNLEELEAEYSRLTCVDSK